MSERRVAPLCEWTGGLVRYKLQPATFGIIIVAARGPGDNVRVVSLGKTDGSPADWLAMSIPERTARAEQLFRHDWKAIHHEG